jgi:uncharacterized protein (TIGR03084 family)
VGRRPLPCPLGDVAAYHSPVPVDLALLAADLRRETEPLEAILATLDASGWATPTPAPGWSVHDQVTHLAYFDGATTTALLDPDRFVAERDSARADTDDLTAMIATRYRGLAAAETLTWFEEARREMVAAFSVADPAQPVPWYGPSMSVGAALTARIMETWAHGQDIADTFGIVRTPTAALRQVAHIGVRALANSFRARGLEPPATGVYVALRAPDGSEWVWGDPGLADRVAGDALEFCLVVTQRRHLADTSLRVEGPVAREWMTIAQAFAGAPGAGRAPGQFTR